MKTDLLNEINGIRYMFGYKPGKVISEQKNQNLNEEDLPIEDIEKQLTATINTLGYSFEKPNDKELSKKAITVKELKDIKPDEFIYLDGVENEIDLERNIYPTSLENEVKTMVDAAEKKVEDKIEDEINKTGLKQAVDAENEAIINSTQSGEESVVNMNESDLTRLVKRIINEDLEMMDVSSDSDYYKSRKREVSIPQDELDVLLSKAKQWCEDKGIRLGSMSRSELKDLSRNNDCGTVGLLHREYYR